MEISLYKSEVTVVQFQDRLDALFVNRVRDTLKELKRSGHNKFVVDLTTVSFIDSQGLGILVSLLHAARGNGGTVHIVSSSSEEPQRLFNVTRLDQVFEMFGTLNAALERFDL